jgi:hypothetical protein
VLVIFAKADVWNVHRENGIHALAVDFSGPPADLLILIRLTRLIQELSINFITQQIYQIFCFKHML